MSTAEEQALAALVASDPAMHDAPPAPGSTRRADILEHAMTQTTLAAAPARLRPPRAPARRPRPGRARTVLGTVLATGLAAAAAAAVVAGTGAWRTPHSPSAPAVVLAAADRTAAVTSFRMEQTSTAPDHTEHFVGEVDGQDAVVHVSGSDDATYYQLGTEQWTVRPGRPPVSETTTSLADLTSSAAHVVTAVVDGGSVHDAGDQAVRGRRADHYKVIPDASTRRALARVPADERELFGLSHLDQVTGIDVWVADGLIQRIDVQGSDGPRTSSSIEFYDVGADITITPPPGIIASSTTG